MLDRLPADVLQCILSRTSPACVVAGVAPVCSCLHASARADGLWRIMLQTRYTRLLSECFDGECPLPVPPLSWREHYFAFPSSFLHHARARGRLLLEIDAVIYDVTTYLHLHPGDPEVLLAAAGHDATAVFREVGHSANAQRQLEQLAIAPRAVLVPSDDQARCRRCEGRDATASGSPLWRVLLGLLAGVRSESGRSKLRQVARMATTAFIRDLSEGRPDCRRLSPAVWRLAGVSLRNLELEPARG